MKNKIIKLTNKEKDILNLALSKLDEYYDEREKTCREFKWICHDHLPQSGDGYVANQNVFNIQDKTIEDIKKSKKEGRALNLFRITNKTKNINI